MRNLFVPAVLVAALIFLTPSASSQDQRTESRLPDPSKPSDVRLPNGRLQQDEILKADHEKSVKDAAQLIDLAESLKQDLEKDDAHVLSISSLKKTEEIEKIAKRIRSRLKRF
jgi:hypothetical protein